MSTTEKPRGTKQPKHFKVHCSIQNHRRVMGIYDDDALLAMYTRIGIMAVERYADKTGDSFVCSGRDLERLAACSGVANAIRKLSRLEAAGGPALTRPTSGQALASARPTLGTQGHTEAGGRPEVGQPEAGYRLTFRNFAKKQGFKIRLNQKRESPSSSSSTSSSTTVTEAPSAHSAGPDFELSAEPERVDPSPLLNLIAKLDGNPDEKSAWLESEWPLIEAEAAADPNPNRVGPIVFRFYRTYLKGERKFRDWTAKQETRRRIAEHEAKFSGVMAEIEAEEGYAAAHR